MPSPEFVNGETGKQVVERFTKATGKTDRIIAYHKCWSHGFLRICVHPRRSVAVTQGKNPRKRPDHARGRSGRNSPCRKLATSLKHCTNPQSPMCMSAA